jgi:DNA-binding beta-propeller fold protein YncE
VLTIDTKLIESDPEKALLGKIAVGTAPVGIAFVNGGSVAVVANSNRFANGTAAGAIAVLDLSSGTGSPSKQRTIAGGAFPREVSALPSGNAVCVTNFDSGSIQIVRTDEVLAGRTP